MCSEDGTSPVACTWDSDSNSILSLTQIDSLTPKPMCLAPWIMSLIRQEFMRKHLVFISNKNPKWLSFLQTHQIDSFSVLETFLIVSPWTVQEIGFHFSLTQPSATSNPAAASTVSPPAGPEKHDYPSTSISRSLFSSMVVRVDWLAALPVTEFYYGEGWRGAETKKWCHHAKEEWQQITTATSY